jgi:hypothetical protein
MPSKSQEVSNRGAVRAVANALSSVYVVNIVSSVRCVCERDQAGTGNMRGVVCARHVVAAG